MKCGTEVVKGSSSLNSQSGCNMAGSISEVDESVLDIVDIIIRQDIPELLKIQDPSEVKNSQSRIAFVFSEKAGKAGGRPVMAKTSRVSPKIAPFLTNPNIEFIVDIAYDEWCGLTPTQRKALLFHELMKFAITENAESGELKVGLRPPELAYFYKELEIFGHWRPDPVEEEGGELERSHFPQEVEMILLGKAVTDSDDDSDLFED